MLFLLTLLPITGCGNAEKASPKVAETTVQATRAESSTPATTTPEATDEATSSSAVDSDLGESKTSGGIKITLLKVTSSRTLTYQGGTIDADATPDGEAVTKKAPQGGRYVYLRTRVLNETSGGIDITCSGPVGVSVYTTDQIQFDPVGSLYLIAGNPDCNKQLQPGFRATMTWVFLIAEGKQVSSFGFHDLTDPVAQAEPAYFFFPPIPH